jgi:hypothetical protein
MDRDPKTIDLTPEEYRSSDGRFIPFLPFGKIAPLRRFICGILGVPLLVAGPWLLIAHILSADGHYSMFAALLAAGMTCGGLALVGSGVTGR